MSRYNLTAPATEPIPVPNLWGVFLGFLLTFIVILSLILVAFRVHMWYANRRFGQVSWFGQTLLFCSVLITSSLQHYGYNRPIFHVIDFKTCLLFIQATFYQPFINLMAVMLGFFATFSAVLILFVVGIKVKEYYDRYRRRQVSWQIWAMLNPIDRTCRLNQGYISFQCNHILHSL